MSDALEDKKDISCTKGPLSFYFDVQKCCGHSVISDEFQWIVAFIPLHSLWDIFDVVKYKSGREIEIGIHPKARVGTPTFFQEHITSFALFVKRPTTNW